MRKNCFSVRKKIEKKVCKFEAVRPRICNVFEIFVPHTIEQFFSQLFRNIMVADYFFVYSYFFQWIKENNQKILGYGNNRKYTEKKILIESKHQFIVKFGNLLAVEKCIVTGRMLFCFQLQNKKIITLPYCSCILRDSHPSPW